MRTLKNLCMAVPLWLATAHNAHGQLAAGAPAYDAPPLSATIGELDEKKRQLHGPRGQEHLPGDAGLPGEQAADLIANGAPMDKATAFLANAQRTGFEENKGQVRTTDGSPAPYVRYRLAQGNTSIFLLPNGIAYQFNRTHLPDGYAALMAEAKRDPKKQEQLREMRDQARLETHRMDMVLEGANMNAHITTEGRSDDYTQYYNHDALDVRSYEKVTYHSVYPGIDWVVYTTAKGMKYDFVVHPGADPALIRLRFKDHEELRLETDGGLIQGNSMGRFTEEKPVSFQNGQEVPTSFVLVGEVLHFSIGAYDRNSTLTIDPARVWGTYYGGSNTDYGFNCVTDASDNVYLSGSSFSNAGIASGGHQNTIGGGQDAMLIKFDENGTRLWSTYYGGTGEEQGVAAAVDGTGNVYLIGSTSSATNIASAGHQNTFGGGSFDGFLVKFDAGGSRVWGTYYGGTGYDVGYSCVLNTSGDLVIAGYTTSTMAIASGGHQNTYGGGGWDGFMAKFSASGTRAWGTYYGGALEDYAYSCAVATDGSIYLAGFTASTTAIASGGHQNTKGALFDAFLVKFNTGGTRIWGTYYGGEQNDVAYSCTVDNTGIAYLNGYTSSTTAIANSGHQNTFGGNVDGFLAKFHPWGGLGWGTYYGGSGADYGRDCATDAEGNVYLIGYGASTTAIASGGHQNTYGGGTNDAFLARFNPNGSRTWATYYGGSADEVGFACTVDAEGNVYAAGYTASSAAISSGGHQNTYGGGTYDAFLAKFRGGPTQDCTGYWGGSTLPGAQCNDNDPCTTGDVYDANCDCAGIFQDTDGDTVCDAIDGCPADPLKTAPGACGCGVADVAASYYADTDGDGFGAGAAIPGFTCDPPANTVTNNTDGCADDPLKQAPGACGCGVADVPATYYADTDGDGFGAGAAIPGFTCDPPANTVTNNTDLCADDPLKQAPGACGCGVADVPATYYADTDGDGFGAGASIPGFTCDPPANTVTNNTDGCADDPLKQAPGACGCGVADVPAIYYADTDGDGFGAGAAIPGFTCDPPANTVTNNTDNCPNTPGLIGSACDADPGPGNIPGTLNAACTCVSDGGCTENVTVELRTDALSSQASWQILEQNSNTVVCSFSIPVNGITSPVTEDCCLPVGCYRLRVLDSGGDGFVSGGITGGFQLRESGINGRRIIDNFGNFTTGGTSSIASTLDNGAFCVPIGNDRPIFSSCDKLDWVSNQFIVATENAAVSGQYNVTNTTSGYEFWIYDPNGSYSYRRFRSHATSDGFGSGATRACHMKINGWINNVLNPHVPANVLMNVRIRGRVVGNNLPFGPACLFKIDPTLASCPRVKLQDNPLNTSDFSCGVNKVFGGGASAANRIVANPPQFTPVVASGNVRYQFRFRIPGEIPAPGSCIVRPPQTSPTLHLNWTTGDKLKCATSYQVDVRVSKDGGATWCIDGASPACSGGGYMAWGKICTVYITTSTHCPGPLQSGSSSSMVVQDGDLTLYPNPNRGDQLFVSLSHVEEGANNVNVDIYDLTGKRVLAHTIPAQDGTLHTNLDLAGKLVSGMYLMNLTVGSRTYTERLVVAD